MRSELDISVELSRVSDNKNEMSGMFDIFCPVLSRHLAIVASDGEGWNEEMFRPSEKRLLKLPESARKRMLEIWGERTSCFLPSPAWEHVSVSARGIPTWEEMCWVKGRFWEDNECVVQFHPPEDKYVNVHENVLHLWKPVGIEFPQPPVECV